MPFYIVNGMPMHIKFGGGRRKPPAPCAAKMGVGNQQRRCCDISSFLCDWPASDGKTCDAPLCSRHSRQVGRDRHYCPTHFHLAQQPDAATPGAPQLSLFTGLLEAQ
jgi:hypothetical protein